MTSPQNPTSRRSLAQRQLVGLSLLPAKGRRRTFLHGLVTIQLMVISSKGYAKVANRSIFNIHRELKSILGDETIEVTKFGSDDLMVELKSNDQAKKLGAIAAFLDIPVTVSPHKSLNSSKGVIRSRDLRCCSEEEMVRN
ncbi:Gag-like protein [Plakobranchus ocellatus]|uniref:Gag-like protein n=1 Tax=Plakobranchus ocellatus TaxID=259542 RepID=A0AAV3YPM0_9GAST|nr:Gag-like protein [Plakobranchus ocellatus]